MKCIDVPANTNLFFDKKPHENMNVSAEKVSTRKNIIACRDLPADFEVSHFLRRRLKKGRYFKRERIILPENLKE